MGKKTTLCSAWCVMFLSGHILSPTSQAIFSLTKQLRKYCLAWPTTQMILKQYPCIPPPQALTVTAGVYLPPPRWKTLQCGLGMENRMGENDEPIAGKSSLTKTWIVPNVLVHMVKSTKVHEIFVLHWPPSSLYHSSPSASLSVSIHFL